MHVLGAGGVDGDEEGEGQPPTHTHQQHRRWQAAGEVGGRLLPRARSLALEFNSPDPLAPTQLMFFCLCYCVLGLKWSVLVKKMHGYLEEERKIKRLCKGEGI
jgi:hypothetical protein